MNPVRTEALSASFGVSGGLGVYCCLSDVRYQIRAHFVCAGNGFHAPKIYSICKRSLVKGGRRETYLGKRMCACSIAPTVFGEGVGYYDDVSWNLGLMYHGLDYHDNGSITARLFECRLDNGVIEFPVPKDCTVYHTIKEGRQHALV